MTIFKQKPNIYLAIIVFIAAASFCILDVQRVSMGDDLGYCFSDTQLHKGDGQPLRNLSDILTTQASHYRTTNGRYIVHSLTQYFVSFAPPMLFPVCNALMFALLLLLSLRLATPTGIRSTPAMAVFMLLLIWICIPRPGTTFLSLTAFAINYLWAAVAYLLFIMALLRSFDSNSRLSVATIAAGVAAIIAGSLQESFSLPLSGAIVIGYICYRKRFSILSYALSIGFGIGTCIVTFAPGNFVRLGAGAPLITKLTLLARDLAFSPLPVLIIALIAVGRTRPALFRRLWRSLFIIFLAIGFSVALASLTFTGVRQLVAMALFCAILLGAITFNSTIRLIIEQPLVKIGMWVALSVIFAGAWIVRQDTIERFRDVIKQAKNPTTRLCADSRSALYNSNPALAAIFSRYNDDPAEGSDLKLLFDANTKKALSRLRKDRLSAEGLDPGRDIVTILPAPVSTIAEAAKSSAITPDSTIIPAPIDDRYSCLAITSNQRHVPCIRNENGAIVHFECFRMGSVVYYVIETPTAPLNLRSRR